MAELFKKLQEEMKAAMKSGDKDRLSTIRMLISEIKKVQIDSKKRTFWWRDCLNSSKVRKTKKRSLPTVLTSWERRFSK